jgi:hypothetical protein
MENHTNNWKIVLFAYKISCIWTVKNLDLNTGYDKQRRVFYICELFQWLMLRSIRFSLFCLKGKIFITAGHRPAAGSKAPLTLPERQDFTLLATSCLSGREGGWMLPSPQVDDLRLWKLRPFRTFRNVRNMSQWLSLFFLHWKVSYAPHGGKWYFEADFRAKRPRKYPVRQSAVFRFWLHNDANNNRFHSKPDTNPHGNHFPHVGINVYVYWLKCPERQSFRNHGSSTRGREEKRVVHTSHCASLVRGFLSCTLHLSSLVYLLTRQLFSKTFA